MDARSLRHVVKSHWALFALAGFAAVIHAGTAVLRLGTFWPYPRLLDFASFYAGAAAIASSRSPYAWEPKYLESLRAFTGLSFSSPISTPLWLWALAPFAWLSFPQAATLWLALLVVIAIYCAVALAHIAGYDSWPMRLLVAMLVLTFGPTVLNFTLGQNGLFLLLSVLLAGQHLVRPRRWTGTATVVSWVLSIAAKLFPLLWLPAFALLRRWRIVFAIASTFVVLSLLSHAIFPAASEDYWLQFLPGQVTGYADTGALDDQSLGAWLDRLGRSRQYSVPGLFVADQRHVEWRAPWEINQRVLDLVSYGILLMVGAAVTITIFQTGTKTPDAALYLWVLFSLLLVPHAERYNHVLLLPAMAWVWGRGGRGYACVVGAYFLAGLGRLTHLWAIFLPAPYAPLLSGSGVIAVLLLITCTAAYMQQAKAVQ